ncbi:MAG: hypothetical protein EZS26_003691 [Candidatus Ordinivivax streblomastigis]|uniref:Transposase n=1 Tax=Candidatus Ordinivivax streblomastigis TaxID=2540710 RepID=A0A5M8NT87_9BACT|nr:MAG: hypothetical protein EZS26_003691 [Candidatus Ordinivivax streblomastigis]
MTYFEFTKRFPTQEDAINYIVDKKYPNEQYVCPKCSAHVPASFWLQIQR